jgi:hypothetical protein
MASRDKERGSLCLKEGRVYGNSTVEPPKCSVMVRVRHHITTRRKERVEFPLNFRENLRNPRREREGERRGGNATRFIIF